MARSSTVTTGTGAVTAALIQGAGGGASFFYGLSATNAEAAIYYIKLYWEGTGTGFTSNSAAGTQIATTIPVAATNIPQLVIPIATPGGYPFVTENVMLNNGGRIWWWATLTAANGSAQSALTNGGDVITFVY